MGAIHVSVVHSQLISKYNRSVELSVAITKPIKITVDATVVVPLPIP